MKIGLSLVVPVTGKLEDCTHIGDFVAHSDTEIDLNVIYLVNNKVAKPESYISSDRLIETLVVGNDRYFGSVEENIFRVQDVSKFLKQFVFFVGEHDRIDWSNMAEALAQARDKNVDVLGVNIMGEQKQKNGASSKGLALPTQARKSTDLCTSVVNNLFSGGVVNGGLAFPSMMALFGPSDWAAFIGSHIYTRDALLRILSFRYSDHVYSFVYANLAYQVSAKSNYGFYEKHVAFRISDEFIKQKEGTHSLGWLEEHRRVSGLSHIFWISQITYINQIENPKLFALLSNCRTLAQRSSDRGEIILKDGFFISDLLIWSYYVLDGSLKSKSFYLKSVDAGCYLYEARAIMNFLKRFSFWTLDSLKNEALSNKLSLAQLSISTYLNNDHANNSSISDAANYVWEAIGLLPENEILTMHNLAVREFSQSVLQ